MNAILLSIRKMLVINEQKLHKGIKRKVKGTNRAYIVIIKVMIPKKEQLLLSLEKVTKSVTENRIIIKHS